MPREADTLCDEVEDLGEEEASGWEGATCAPLHGATRGVRFTRTYEDWEVPSGKGGWTCIAEIKEGGRPRLTGPQYVWEVGGDDPSGFPFAAMRQDEPADLLEVVTKATEAFEACVLEGGEAPWAEGEGEDEDEGW